MTDRDIIFGVVNKLDKGQFDVISLHNGTTWIDVYRKKSDTEITFEFDKEGNLTDIWTE